MSDTDWASCVRTCRSFIGSLIKLAGAAVAYKTQLQDTVATSSTESKFMAAYEVGKMLLYVRSILWDLDVPQEAANRLYKDNDACTPMANAQKPISGPSKSHRKSVIRVHYPGEDDCAHL